MSSLLMAVTQSDMSVGPDLDKLAAVMNLHLCLVAL